TFANGIGERIKELQALAAEQTVESADKCIQELNELRRQAKADKAYGAAVSAVMGKAKIMNFTNEQPKQLVDFNQANSMQDIGRKLLCNPWGLLRRMMFPLLRLSWPTMRSLSALRQYAMLLKGLQ